MKFGVVVFPGSNCDHDCYFALKHVFMQDVEFIWHREKSVDGFDAIILPGGFSYGDYLRTGAIARFSPVMNAIVDFAENSGYVIGICNGFQILCETGLLPGVLMRNEKLRFVCKFANLRVENNQTAFTNKCAKNEVLHIPIAHAEGRFYADEKTLKSLIANDQILFRYCERDGAIAKNANPNGSVDNIAGITNQKGNVMGMMPHPDRCFEDVLNSSDGAKIFQSIIDWMGSPVEVGG